MTGFARWLVTTGSALFLPVVFAASGEDFDTANSTVNCMVFQGANYETICPAGNWNFEEVTIPDCPQGVLGSCDQCLINVPESASRHWVRGQEVLPSGFDQFIYNCRVDIGGMTPVCRQKCPVSTSSTASLTKGKGELLSIVIITLNEEKRIGRLLKDLTLQTHQNFEIIVVDSDSSDATLKVAASYASKFREFRTHRMLTKGVALGRNTGARLAHYNRLLFLDADVRLSATFIQEALEALNKYKLDVAGNYLLADSEAGWMGWFTYSFLNTLMPISTAFASSQLFGACMFSTQKAHQAIGGFDKTIDLCEESNYMDRAYAEGFKKGYTGLYFTHDYRRFSEEGLMTVMWKYTKTNAMRSFGYEARNGAVEYQYGHYKKSISPK